MQRASVNFYGRWKHLMVNYSTKQLLSPSPERQIAKASAFLELYGGGQEGFRPSDIPAALSFTPRTKTERSLLAVYLPNKGSIKGFRRTFDNWWDFIVPPTGGTKLRWDGLNSDAKHLLLASGVIKYIPGIRWVAFDSNTYQGKSPKDALAQSAIDDDGTTLAHAEVLMAAAQFPGWVSSWNGGISPYPYMSALQFYRSASWSCVPRLSSCNGNHLYLDTRWANHEDSRWSSPVVREC